jgi:hypothetical protein
MGRIVLTRSVLVAALAIAGGRAEAQAPLTVTLEGTFTKLDGASCPDDGSILPRTGSSFALTYAYDAGQAPAWGVPGIARYDFSGAPNQVGLVVNGVKLFETNSFKAYVRNSDIDGLILEAWLTDQPEWVGFGLYFYDFSATALGSVALPTSAPNLAAWPSQHVVALGTNVRGPSCGVEDGAIAGFQIQGDVTKVTSGPAILEVAIDIKPGSGSPATVALGSAGVIPVAILSSADFDATTVLPESVSLAGAKVRLIGRAGRYSCASSDVDGDGRLDLLCHVETAQFFLEPGESLAVLEAETTDGRLLRGQDTVRIVH